MKIIGIDPGNVKSALVGIKTDPVPSVPIYHLLLNKEIEQIIEGLSQNGSYHVFIEMVANMGMVVGKSIFDTCRQVGKFEKTFEKALNIEPILIYRKDVKMYLCNSTRAKDTNIRRALIELWGGDNKAIGGKKCLKCKGKGWAGVGRPVCPKCNGDKWKHPPGPLKYLHDDLWASLGVAMTGLNNMLKYEGMKKIGF